LLVFAYRETITEHHEGEHMIEILQEYLEQPNKASKCVVKSWLLEKPQEAQDLFEQLMQKRGLNMSALYSSLEKTEELPFKITVFRMHMKGYCACPKN